MKETIHTIKSVKSIEAIFHQAWCHVCYGEGSHMVYHYGEWVNDLLREILQANESNADAAWEAILKARAESKLINCTPHDVNVYNDDLEVIMNIPVSENAARLDQSTEVVGSILGVPMTETVFGGTTNLPQQQTNVFIIVSRLVMAKNPERDDLLVPNEAVRDDNGHINLKKGKIIGCKSFARN